MPLFCSTALAARIEAAEAALVADGARAAAVSRPPEEAARIFVRPLAGGFAVWAGEGSPLNKVAGPGIGQPPGTVELDAIDRLERDCFERGSAVRFEISTLADPSLASQLTRRGYELVGFENVLALPLAHYSPMPLAEGVTIQPAGSSASEFETWLDIVVDGFAHPDEQGVATDESFPREVIAQVIGEMTAAPGFSRYLATLEGQPAGGGSLRVSAEQKVAQLAGAATAPAFRRRGVQSSLLTTRLAAARAAGCEVAVVTTQPGSKSQQNVQRQGFELLYARAVLVREP